MNNDYNEKKLRMQFDINTIQHLGIYHGINQNWVLTPREAARLQTFPDDYFFESFSEKPGFTAAYYQIRNEVPDLLSQKIAEKLHEVW